jgi:hypothetical protein
MALKNGYKIEIIQLLLGMKLNLNHCLVSNPRSTGSTAEMNDVWQL